MTDAQQEADPVGRLRSAGFDLSQFDDEQLEVLATLSTDEVSVLLDISERIGEVGPEVEAHGEMREPGAIGGLLF
jgi:hypothetical protein